MQIFFFFFLMTKTNEISSQYHSNFTFCYFLLPDGKLCKALLWYLPPTFFFFTKAKAGIKLFLLHWVFAIKLVLGYGISTHKCHGKNKDVLQKTGNKPQSELATTLIMGVLEIVFPSFLIEESHFITSAEGSLCERNAVMLLTNPSENDTTFC